MFFSSINIIKLFIAPQLWLEPFVGLPVDIILYPSWLIALAFTGKIKHFFSLSYQDKIFLALIVWIIITSLANPSNPNTVNIIVGYINFFIVYKLVYSSISSFDEYKKLSLFLVFIVFFLVFEGIYHKHSIDGLGWAGQPLGWADEQILKSSGSGRTQWIGIFDGPGVFCVVYTTALPFLLQYISKPYSKFQNIFAAILIVLILFAIYYTGSRGGFLATMSIFALYMMYKFKISLSRLIVVSTIMFSLLAIAPSYLTSTRDSHGSAQNRVDMWGEGIEMVEHNPFFGIGKGNYADYTGKLIAHNSAIEIMGETGLFGLFLWISLIYISLKYLYYYHQSTDNIYHKSYTTALAISIGGYITSSMFVTLEYETLYFLFALCGVIGNKLSSNIKLTQKDFSIIAYVVIGWFVVLKLFVMVYFS